MYDFPELREAHDAFWSALAGRLVNAGVQGVPVRLNRALSHRALWGHASLLFSQGCEYPLAKSFSDRVRLIARPCYSAPGCEGSDYRSAIVVRANERGASLTDFRGRRCAVNETDSNSGMNLLRAAVAPHARATRFFSAVTLSGSHLKSAQMVADGQADLAAIDCVSFEHFRRLYPSSVGRLRVLGWTDPSPALPFITSRSASESDVEAIRSALADMFENPTLSAVRERLLLQDIELQPEEGFVAVLGLEKRAVRAGYLAIDGLEY